MPVSLQIALLAGCNSHGAKCIQQMWKSWGKSKSDYFEGGEGVASGSLSFHWVIALALATEQPFPGWLWRRADAAADSAVPFL